MGSPRIAPGRCATFTESLKGAIQLEQLPAYAPPELSPVEYVWGYLKHHALANFCVRMTSLNTPKSHSARCAPCSGSLHG